MTLTEPLKVTNARGVTVAPPCTVTTGLGTAVGREVDVRVGFGMMLAVATRVAVAEGLVVAVPEGGWVGVVVTVGSAVCVGVLNCVAVGVLVGVGVAGVGVAGVWPLSIIALNAERALSQSSGSADQLISVRLQVGSLGSSTPTSHSTRGTAALTIAAVAAGSMERARFR